MNTHWNRRYLLKSYIRGSLWLVPFLAVVLFWVVSRVTYGVDNWLQQTGQINGVTGFYGLTVTGARSLLETVITANLSFLVFTFSSLLVAIQVAGGQYTPRIIATTLLRDNAIRFSVGFFIFAILFAGRAQMKMGDSTVHQLNTFIAGVLGLGSVVVFLYLIDYAARFLRPVSIVQRVGESGIAVIKAVYPESTTGTRESGFSRRRESPSRTVTHAGTSSVLLAVNLEALLVQAQRAGSIIEIVPEVGDFVATDDPLFRLYGGTVAINEPQLRASLALGTERTLDQDPTFAFRILVDIAIKALSPAINDPTTAVLAIDQLHRLLRMVGLRHVSREEICDDAGELRVIFRTPNWEDFVHLTCTEIRHCGGNSVQIMRRMRSLLENLMQTLPIHRHAELRQQLELLDRTVERQFPFPEDRVLASLPDPQGLGGSVGLQPVIESPNGEPGGRSKN
jgi:uncharacterized membrane protein